VAGGVTHIIASQQFQELQKEVGERMIHRDRDKLINRTPQVAILVNLISIVWWIGWWGLIETLLQEFIAGSFHRAICIYCTLIAGCVMVVFCNPQILHYFI